MPDIASSFQSAILPKLGQEPSSSRGLKAWFLSGQYQVTTGSGPNDIQFQQVQLDDILPYISFDFERFALASWESFSIAMLERTAVGLVGWPLIKTYYSGFYAAHAIMRGCGSGVVVLDGNIASQLDIIAQAYGLPANFVNPGQYVYELSSHSGSMLLELSPTPKAGGVHEGFWAQFVAFLNLAADRAVQSGAPDAASFLAGVVELVDALSHPGGNSPGWLSKIRNEINYLQLYDSWYPFPKSSQSAAAVTAVSHKPSASISISREKVKDPVRPFLETSVYLACLCFELSEYVSKRSTKGRAFGQKWRRLLEMTK